VADDEALRQAVAVVVGVVEQVRRRRHAEPRVAGGRADEAPREDGLARAEVAGEADGLARRRVGAKGRAELLHARLVGDADRHGSARQRQRPRASRREHRGEAEGSAHRAELFATSLFNKKISYF